MSSRAMNLWHIQVQRNPKEIIYHHPPRLRSWAHHLRSYRRDLPKQINHLPCPLIKLHPDRTPRGAIQFNIPNAGQQHTVPFHHRGMPPQAQSTDLSVDGMGFAHYLSSRMAYDQLYGPISQNITTLGVQPNMTMHQSIHQYLSPSGYGIPPMPQPTRNMHIHAEQNTPKGDAVFTQILEFIRSFCGLPSLSAAETHGASSASGLGFPSGVNIRNTRDKAFVFSHRDAVGGDMGIPKGTAQLRTPQGHNSHNFMPRPYGTKIVSVFEERQGGRLVLLVWMELKSAVRQETDLGLVASEYKGILNGLQMYHQLDGDETVSLLPMNQWSTNEKKEHSFRPLGPWEAMSITEPPRSQHSSSTERTIGVRTLPRGRSRSPSRERSETYRDRQPHQRLSASVKREENLKEILRQRKFGRSEGSLSDNEIKQEVEIKQEEQIEIKREEAD